MTDRTIPAVSAAGRVAPVLATLALAAAVAWPGVAGAQPAAAPAAAPIAALPDFSELAERVGPAVVNIRTTERVRSSGARELDPGFEEFLRRFGIPLPRSGPRGGDGDDEASGGQTQPRGVGSGFVISADGYVMTNAHVVDGAEEVIVTLTDKRELKARIVGADTRTDVAVVKIDATGLPTVKIGDVGRLKVGEWVLAIGSPFGLDNTVTAGIVSAKQRDTGDYLNFIQTDVAINPGNSGGPLLNLRGEVVGINSQIYSRSGGFMGISFAIPIDDAIRVADQLRATGRVVRGRIGVQIAPVTQEVAEAIGLGKAAGALVRNVEKGGPADKAGVEAGDIITRVDGKPVERSGELPRIVGAIKPGSQSTLTVFRRGAPRDLKVTVAEFEDDRPARAGATPGSAPAAKSVLGLTVTELGEAQKRQLGVRGGVRVDTVEGAAARAGLRPGDVILALDNTDISDARQFQALAAKAEKSRVVSVLVRRGDAVNYFVIRPSR
ncbi:DegQ family serine endoprotease [Rubrivivax benzoatilyticus]|uniref:Probable periplasmic serine endoprotease DegP-like n=2 Tax=Rubrivivax benzoatilyticus TaxID=316997 RepID=A0ABX0HWN6_9BURK|nr:DegQ family serine endoprotease [Rubrivivax benzoatilyticus]NHK97963.1 DegQ family serine endoprotease [Rubrivivax benzoatilyticus]NHL23465.1 DegQ family serine endoprotease [Rubrivivax benzoatilyticus]